MLTVRKFLNDYIGISKELEDIMYHTGVTNYNVKQVVRECGINFNKPCDEVALELQEALLSCYSNSENFNEDLYIRLVRLTTRCDKFYLPTFYYHEDDEENLGERRYLK